MFNTNINNRKKRIKFVDFWTGYAGQIVSKTGQRKVVIGRTTHFLEYDEYLEPITLSTGTPKTTENKLKTVYLRVKNNKISDISNFDVKNLERLRLEDNQISDISEFDAKNLKELGLNNNQISDISKFVVKNIKHFNY